MPSESVFWIHKQESESAAQLCLAPKAPYDGSPFSPLLRAADKFRQKLSSAVVAAVHSQRFSIVTSLHDSLYHSPRARFAFALAQETRCSRLQFTHSVIISFDVIGGITFTRVPIFGGEERKARKVIARREGPERKIRFAFRLSLDAQWRGIVTYARSSIHKAAIISHSSHSRFDLTCITGA